MIQFRKLAWAGGSYKKRMMKWHMMDKAGQFGGVVKADFSGEVISQWRLEGWEGASCVESGRGKSRCKGPEVGLKREKKLS